MDNLLKWTFHRGEWTAASAMPGAQYCIGINPDGRFHLVGTTTTLTGGDPADGPWLNTFDRLSEAQSACELREAIIVENLSHDIFPIELVLVVRHRDGKYQVSMDNCQFSQLDFGDTVTNAVRILNNHAKGITSCPSAGIPAGSYQSIARRELEDGVPD